MTRLMMVCAAAWLLSDSAAMQRTPKRMGGMPLLFRDDFASGDTSRWELTDATAWRIATDGDAKVFHLTKDSSYRAKVRSPDSIAWLKDIAVSDFVLEAWVKSLGRPDDGHRDLCLFWGRQDPEHFYYVHFGKKADPHANSIFLVNGAPRVSIAKTRTNGTPWDHAYHHVRVVRDTKTGKIDVYFDDMLKPVMTAVDRTFTSGRVGIGSFDNTGYFDEVTLWGRKAKP